MTRCEDFPRCGHEMRCCIGRRVELHPGCDLWMMGARFGTITAIKGDMFTVRVGGVLKLQRFLSDRLRFAEAKAEYGLLKNDKGTTK